MTTIKTLQNGDVEVTREFEFFDGQDFVTESRTAIYTKHGAYVYKVNPNGTTSQVCEGLRPTGPTLRADGDLAEVIRRTLAA